MFETLRNQLLEENVTELLGSAVTEGTLDTVKDRFLSDPVYVTLGAENDPQIEKLVNAVPEFGIDTSKMVEKLTESLIVEE